MTAAGWRASMLFRARLVFFFLLFLFPLASFEIPLFLSGSNRVFPGSARVFPRWVQDALPTRSIAVLGASQPERHTPAPTPDWVARQVDARDTGRDSRTEMQMRLFDRQDRRRDRALTVLGLDGDANLQEGNNAIGDRLLMRFTAPSDIEGTAFLVWERRAGEDERFLFLPALGRVRRIAGAERQESFVGSDFTYEDIGGRAFDDYAYAFAETDATWTASDGSTRPAWRLESKARDADAAYPRVVSLVRKDNFVVVQADIFNRRGEREKEFRVARLDRVDGIWTIREMVMRNQLARTRTELVVTAVKYNVGLDEGDFSRRELERGTR